MRIWLRGSSSRNSEETPEEKPKYNLPRVAGVRPCEWPSDPFLKEAGIHEDFYYLANNVGIIPFLKDKCNQYLLLTNTFLQNFRFYPRKEPPMVEFNLYDVPKEMKLYEFCNACKLPYEGSHSDPHRIDMEDFIFETTLGGRERSVGSGSG